MNPARKLKYGTAIIVLGMLAALPPGVAEATPVDPAIMARFKKVAPFQQRLAALRNKLLIEKGRRLFTSETFKGNGRTCATCHPASNNFTIDPAFIQNLHRRKPRDPLFVAEFNPALQSLENPALMLQFGLILENLDGFTNPGVMRGVPHTLGMSVSMNAPAERPRPDPPRRHRKGGHGLVGGRGARGRLATRIRYRRGRAAFSQNTGPQRR